jgi:acyl carrier protein
MTDQEILDTLRSIVNEIAGVAEADIQLDKSFVDDLDVDSLSMVEISMAAEEKFGVSIPDSELKNLKTVADVVNFVKANS